MAKSERTSMSNSPVMKGAAAFFGDDVIEQQDSKLLKQQDALPVKQQNAKIESQQDVKEVEQQNGKVDLVKVTYYITPEQDLKLERVRLARRSKDRNKKIDKSALIREAIESMEE